MPSQNPVFIPGPTNIPAGFDSTKVVVHAAAKYGVAAAQEYYHGSASALSEAA